MKLLPYLLKCIPFLSVLVLIMGGSSLRIGGNPLLPGLFLIPVYYWIVFRPQGLSLWSLFGIGLFYDSLMGYELGLSSLLLMLSAFCGQYIRPLLISHSFSLIWGTFCLYSFVYLLLYGLWGGTLFASWIYAIILYPLITWILSYLHLRLRSYV